MNAARVQKVMIQDLDLVAARHQQLTMFCEESRLASMLEHHLLGSLHDIREQQRKADRFVLAILDEADERFSPEQRKILTGGLEDRVADIAARARREENP